MILDLEDEDFGLTEQVKKTQYSDYLEEFIQAIGLFIEIDSDRENILSEYFNSISIGMAFSYDKVAVVTVFLYWPAIITNLNINMVNWSVKLSGKIISTELGPYAIRIVNEDHIHKTQLSVSFQFIKFDPTTQSFSVDFTNDENKDKNKKQFLELYLREHPNLIKYGSVCDDKLDYKSLRLGFRIPYEVYPNPIKVKEEEQEDMMKEERAYEKERKVEEAKRNDQKEIERMRKIYDTVNTHENDD